MDDTERRIRAAMSLGGIDGFSELAAAINQRNFGATKLRTLSDKSENAISAKREIAFACGLPYEFFTVDFGRLPLMKEPAETASDPLVEVRDELRLLAARLATVEAEVLPPYGETPAANEGRSRAGQQQ